MKLVSMKISGPEAYESWSGLKGSVILKGDLGTQEIVLAPGSISRILNSLGVELSRTAHEQADQVAGAVNDAVDGGLLLESDGNVQIVSSEIHF